MANRLVSSDSYIIPVVLAVLVHFLIFAGFFMVWSSTPEVPTTAKPTMIATLYEVQSKSPATAKSSEKLAGVSNKTAAPLAKDNQLATQKAEQQKIVEQQANAAKAEALAKQKAEQQAKEAKAKVDAIAKRQAKEKAKAEALAKQQAEDKAKANALAKKKKQAEEKAKADAAARKAQEDKEAQALADLLSDKVEHKASMGDQLGEKVVGDLDSLVRQLVQANWTELGNPAPETRVELMIQMSPDGTITHVMVSRSSGNAIFDASAVTAARNVGRIPEIKQLDSNTFNKLYKQRKFVFYSKGSIQ